MEAILTEKEFIMREVNHRIRNNLQMISSFLSLEATLFPTKNIDEIIYSCQSRIMSLSLLHENLHQSTFSNYMDVKIYLQSLIANLTQSQPSKKPNIQFELESTLFKVDQLIPLGLLVNEMISIGMNENSDKKNNFQIHLTGKIVNSTYQLDYNSPKIIQQNYFGKDSLSMKLINGFARQLDSKLSFESSNEIIIKNSIPIPELKINNYI